MTRRLQDISEQQGSNMILLFLDWEKAFDRTKHDRLWIALQRLGIHEHFIDVFCKMATGKLRSLWKTNMEHHKLKNNAQA